MNAEADALCGGAQREPSPVRIKIKTRSGYQERACDTLETRGARLPPRDIFGRGRSGRATAAFDFRAERCDNNNVTLPSNSDSTTWPLTATGPAKPRVQSVSRALTILMQVAASTDGLTVAEISRRTGLRQATTYHLIHTLNAAGFLAKGTQKKYRLGLSIGTLVEAFGRQIAPPEHLLPHVRSLALATGEAAFAVGWVDGEVVALCQVPGQHALTVSAFHVGQVGDAHARSSGKLLLAFAPPGVRERYLRSHPPQQRTPHTLVDPEDLDREFTKIRMEGYATDIEEFALGVCCLAAPLDGGASPFAFSISTPKERFERNFDSYLQAILQATRAASAGSAFASAPQMLNVEPTGTSAADRAEP